VCCGPLQERRPAGRLSLALGTDPTVCFLLDPISQLTLKLQVSTMPRFLLAVPA
jgi:hypothetical protein